MKAFFGKIWAWVLAHKVLAAIIAGATVVVLTVAIVVPVSVSSAKKRKAAEQETQQSGGGSQQNNDGGKQQGGGDQGHTHSYTFDSFVWTTTAGNYTAKAKYVCAADSAEELHDATVTKLGSSTAATCEAAGVNHWHAEYEGHTDDKDENLAALGHNWQVSWQWEGYTTATATFTCANDASHTHQEVASGSAITNEVINQPSCAATGLKRYTATVSFEEQNYTNTKDESMAIVDHAPANIDEHNFCTLCGEYLGDTKATNTDFSVNASGTYFFRVPCNPGQHFWFLLENNEMQAVGAVRGYIRNNDEFIQQAGAYNAFIDQDDIDNGDYPTLMFVSDSSSDGYLYIEIEEYTNAGLDFDMSANTEHLYNDAGLCVGGDSYLGSPEELYTDIYLGTEDGEGHYQLAADDQEYYSFICEPNHSYRLGKDLISADEIYVYYVSRTTHELVELVRSAGVFNTPMSTVFDGNVYVAICPMAACVDAYIRITVEGHGDPLQFDDYGFCAAGDGYIGNIVSSDSTETSINISEGEKAFYAFQFDPGHKYSFGDDTGEISYDWIKAYVIDKSSDEITPLALTHSNPFNFTDVMVESADNYIYLVIEPTADVIAGELQITTIHVYEHGLCVPCGDYLGTQLTLDVAAADITVSSGEHVYFNFDLADLPANKPVLEITYTSSTNPSTSIGYDIVSVWYLKDGEWVEIEDNDLYGNSNWDVGYFPTMGITTDDGNVYIDIHADKNYTNSPGFVVSAVTE